MLFTEDYHSFFYLLWYARSFFLLILAMFQINHILNCLFEINLQYLENIVVNLTLWLALSHFWIIYNAIFGKTPCFARWAPQTPPPLIFIFFKRRRGGGGELRYKNERPRKKSCKTFPPHTLLISVCLSVRPTLYYQLFFLPLYLVI